MILILSTNVGEYTTDVVIDWLDYKKIKYARVNGIDIIEGGLKIDFNEVKIITKYETINLSEVKSFWYRRSISYNYFLVEYKQFTKDIFLNIELAGNINAEFNRIINFIGVFYKDVPWLSQIETSSLNKLEVLHFAKQLNITIPDTLIVNSKIELKAFKKKHDAIIVKSMSEMLSLVKKDKVYTGYTNIVTDEMINNLPEKFYPSLFQEAIEKEYELRIFYLNKKFYSMAIFSQSDEQTKTDFRDYNQEKPNRNIPFLLPKEMEKKLTLLMEKMNLNCGSIDMIKSKEGEYVFLEINSVGQFGMVSRPCNYYLEEKVADFLNSNIN